MSEFATTLDQAIDRLRRGEAPAAILADYPAQAESLGELLMAAQMLDALRPVPLPAAAELTADREGFLAQLAQLPPPAASVGPLVRLNRWITQHPLLLLIQTYLFKEQRRMSTLLVKAMLVFTLILGTAGSAAVAAAHSLPGSPLYPLKLGWEEANLALTGDPVQQASQWQARVSERATEMVQLATTGQPIDEADVARLQAQTQTCLRRLANLPDPVMGQHLQQFQQMVQQQQQLLEQAGGNQVRAAVQTMIQARQAAAEGQVDPAGFRYRYGVRQPDAPTPTPGVEHPTRTPAVTPVKPTRAPQPTATTHRDEAQATRIPTGTAHRYGPQPTTQPNGNPAGQNTPTGAANQYGPQPTRTLAATSAPGVKSTRTPTGEANQYGSQTVTPQPTNAGNGIPATTGEANQYGLQTATPQPGNVSGGTDNSAGTGSSDNSGGSGSGSSGGGSGSSGGHSGSSGGSKGGRK